MRRLANPTPNPTPEPGPNPAPEPEPAPDPSPDPNPYPNKVRVAKLDSDLAPELSSRLRVEGLPTLIFMRGGEEVSPEP